jgi:hypothetical protein
VPKAAPVVGTLAIEIADNCAVGVPTVAASVIGTANAIEPAKHKTEAKLPSVDKRFTNHSSLHSNFHGTIFTFTLITSNSSISLRLLKTNMLSLFTTVHRYGIIGGVYATSPDLTIPRLVALTGRSVP